MCLSSFLGEQTQDCSWCVSHTCRQEECITLPVQYGASSCTCPRGINIEYDKHHMRSYTYPKNHISYDLQDTVLLHTEYVIYIFESCVPTGLNHRC